MINAERDVFETWKSVLYPLFLNETFVDVFDVCDH